MSRGLQQKCPNERAAARPAPRTSGSRRVRPSSSVASRSSPVISRSSPGQSPLAKKKVVTPSSSIAPAHRAAVAAPLGTSASSFSSLRIHRAAMEHDAVPSPNISHKPLQGSGRSTRMMADAKQSHAREADAQLIAVLKDKVLKFREMLNLPPRTACLTLHELLLGTLKDLEQSYMLCILVADYDSESPNEVLLQFSKILKYVGDLWNAKCCESEKINFKEVDEEDLSRENLGGIVLDRLDQMSSRMKQMFCPLEKGSSSSSSSCTTSESEGDLAKATNCGNPLTPTSVLPEASERTVNSNDVGNGAVAGIACMPPVLQPLSRLRQAIGKLKALDANKHLSFHMFPLVLDQNSQPVQPQQVQGGTNDNLKAESVNAVMIMEPLISPANFKEEDEPHIFSFPIPTSTSSSSSSDLTGSTPPIFVSCMTTTSPNPCTTNSNALSSTWQMTHIDSGSEDSKSNGKPPEAAILVAPSLPLLRLRASLLSPTPTPPSSPMVLTTGIPMFFHSTTELMEMEPATNEEDALQVDELRKCKPSGTSSMSDVPVQPSLVPHQLPSHSTTPLTMTNTSAPSPPPPPTMPLPPLSRVKLSPLSPVVPPPTPPSTPHSLTASPLKPPAPPSASASARGVAPPPPPQGLAKSAIRTRRDATKLKRSNQMGSLYRLLKGKVEGSSLPCKASHGRNNQNNGPSSSGNNKAQGMADALAEITKRSTYFRQIEEDVGKYASAIREVKSALNSFQTKDMVELLSFHRSVEQRLENLTDETQVLARFEGFPSKKLETVRMAASLYRKLDSIIAKLKGWNIASPVAQQLGQIESFFNKIKEEVDVIERTKDEESKRFQSHRIEFDFNILVKIKESMVDLSSNCIEIALKESKEAREMVNGGRCTPIDLSKMLWRAFQLAFRVYNFAGGQDDRADRLAAELAHEIETCYQC